MLKKIQKFGGAMMVPVMLMPFAGIVIGLSTVFMNPDIIGSIASDNKIWMWFWSMMNDGGYAIFNQLPLLFAISFPIGLVNKAKERAVIESFVIYITFNYFIQSILSFGGPLFNVDFTQEVGGISGLTMIAGIKTLDMSILGGILVASMVAFIHNKFYDKKLSDYLSAFQGSALVVIVGFFVMIPTALLVCLFWPKVQIGILGMQTMLSKSGTLGVWLFTFMERITIPTGLHHFLWTPFDLGPAVIADGNWTHWMANINEFASSTIPLKTQFPTGGFALYGNVAVWGIPAMSLAMYKLSLPENKKRVASLLIPITITAMLTGVTEPVEFMFLFAAPILFVVESLLAATLSAVLFSLGVVGYQGGGLLDYVTYNWIPLFKNHSSVVLTHIVVGLVFSVIFYFTFYYLIKKLNLPTPGRKAAQESVSGSPIIEYSDRAKGILEALGGTENIEALTNCMTRLRVSVIDETLVQGSEVFESYGAHGVVKNNKGIQVVIGLGVENLREDISQIMEVEI